MVKYYRILKEAWNKLLRDCYSRKFKPLEEADIQCYLYYLCLKKIKRPAKIHAEWNRKGKYIDLMFGNESLPVEIKWSWLRKSNQINPRWVVDVKKLSKKFSGRKPAALIFITRENSLMCIKKKDLLKTQLAMFNKFKKFASKCGVRVLFSYLA